MLERNFKVLTNHREKSQKRLERQECVTDGQMYMQAIAESTLPRQHRLKECNTSFVMKVHLKYKVYFIPNKRCNMEQLFEGNNSRISKDGKVLR